MGGSCPYRLARQPQVASDSRSAPYDGCRGHDVMPEWVRTAVLRVPGVEHVDVTLAFDPPWTPERINDRVRR